MAAETSSGDFLGVRGTCRNISSNLLMIRCSERILGPEALSVPIPNTDTCLVQLIERFLRTEAGHLCIFEEPVGRSDDPWISSADTRVRIFETEVYHLLIPEDVGSGLIEKTIRRADGAYPPMIGALAPIADDAESLLASRALTRETMRNLAERS